MESNIITRNMKAVAAGTGAAGGAVVVAPILSTIIMGVASLLVELGIRPTMPDVTLVDSVSFVLATILTAVFATWWAPKNQPEVK